MAFVTPKKNSHGSKLLKSISTSIGSTPESSPSKSPLQGGSQQLHAGDRFISSRAVDHEPYNNFDTKAEIFSLASQQTLLDKSAGATGVLTLAVQPNQSTGGIEDSYYSYTTSVYSGNSIGGGNVVGPAGNQENMLNTGNSCYQTDENQRMYTTLLQNQVLGVQNPHLIQGGYLNDDYMDSLGSVEKSIPFSLAPPSSYNVLRFS